jgi:hypothetical protein
MIAHADAVSLQLIRSIVCRLDSGLVYLRIADAIISREGDREKAVEALQKQRALLAAELTKLDAAITVCGLIVPPGGEGGA